MQPPTASKRQIVIVEDSALNVMILEARLRPTFDLKIASNVASGLALLDLLAAGPPPHLVLSDYALPDGDGFTILMHAQLRFPDVPRILMSSSPPSDLDLRIGFGLVNRFLRKPIRVQDLLSL